jgi:hypothetical protein
VENAELLSLDAMLGVAPTIWVTLTTRSVTTNTASFYESRRLVMRALKRRWPDVQYWATLEFTTGYGRNSGGDRRPHWHLMLKGIPVDELDRAAIVIRDVWCRREDADRDAQHVGLIHNAGGLMRYLVMHMAKEKQAPPADWHGIRSTHSRGYLWTTTPQAREQAREQLQHKRELWKAEQRGLDAHEAELAAHEAMQACKDVTWRFHQLYREGAPEKELVKRRASQAIWTLGAEDYPTEEAPTAPIVHAEVPHWAYDLHCGEG